MPDQDSVADRFDRRVTNGEAMSVVAYVLLTVAVFAVLGTDDLPRRRFVLTGEVLGEHIHRGHRLVGAGTGRSARTAGRLHVPRLHLGERLANRKGHLPGHRRRPEGRTAVVRLREKPSGFFSGQRPVLVLLRAVAGQAATASA